MEDVLAFSRQHAHVTTFLEINDADRDIEYVARRVDSGSGSVTDVELEVPA